jgi:hypothetical protein
MKVKDIMREDNTMYKVIKNDPTTGIELQRPDDPHSTLHLDPEAAKAIAANPDNPNQFTMNPAIVGAMGADAPQGPQQGAEVEIPATEDYELDQDMIQKGRRNRGIGGDATDNYIDDITDHDFEKNAHEDFLGFGNKSPEEWAKTSKQMADLLKLQKAYQGTQYQSQIEKRIKILKDRLDMDAGEVAGPGGMPKPVVPPEKFNQFNEIGEVPAPPTAEVDPGAEILDIAATPEAKAFIDANTVRDAEGDVDFAGSLGQMMTKASAEMDIKGLQAALAEMEVNFKAFPSTPEFQAMSPEDQADWKQKAPEGMQAMRGLAAQFIKLQQMFAASGQQMTDLSKTADYQKNNPMKGVTSLVPQRPAATPAPVQESADDKLLQKMLSIAGLR